MDGHIERPIGLPEGIVATSCAVEYEHTFAVVDFGKNPNYDIILGRPFMRQLKIIQDWGLIISTYGNRRPLHALIC